MVPTHARRPPPLVTGGVFVRPRARWLRAFGSQTIDDPIELLHEPIEPAHGLGSLGGTLARRSILGRGHGMQHAGDGSHSGHDKSRNRPPSRWIRPASGGDERNGCAAAGGTVHGEVSVGLSGGLRGCGGPPREYAAGGMNATAQEKFRDPSLVDFGASPAGAGRRLELLGGVLVDRPLAGPALPEKRTDLWSQAAAVYSVDGSTGRWEIAASVPDPWRVGVPLDDVTLSLEVRPAPSGQIGVFLEQADQWRWLATRTPAAARMLSLFAHSGAASLALAAAGAEVVHVDASRQAIALARRNAAASGLDAAPIRWVCEDARTFVAREVRRGARYAGAVLDPPTWGHGPREQAFAIERDLAPLLADVARLLAGAPSPGPVLLTCHAVRWNHRRLRDTLAASCPSRGLESGPLACVDAGGRTLHLGDYARWSHC